MTDALASSAAEAAVFKAHIETLEPDLHAANSSLQETSAHIAVLVDRISLLQGIMVFCLNFKGAT
jgi:hypothetical protein